MPANAPAGSDSGEREALTRIVERAAARRGHGLVVGQCECIVDDLILAGFTRAQHDDGERVAALEKERDAATNNHACLKQVWDDQCAHVFEACKMLGADTDAQPGDSWTLREWCLRVVRERDEARAMHAVYVTMAAQTERALRAERDALAEALRRIVYDSPETALRSTSRILADVVDIARAALAGNGNGNGTGEGASHGH